MNELKRGFQEKQRVSDGAFVYTEDTNKEYNLNWTSLIGMIHNENQTRDYKIARPEH